MTPGDVLQIIWQLFALTWWLILPPFLFFTFLEMWRGYVEGLYLRSMTWTLLEIKVPKNISRTPKAMEQIFAALHGFQSSPKFVDKWWTGKVSDWVSFELVGHKGGLTFYVRTPEGYRNLIEAAGYDQYPEAEIVEAVDYVQDLPSILPNETYDLFGMNFMLAKEDAYPIRTYEYFEDKEDERRLDPIAAITEVMSKLKEGEIMWIQLLVEPAGDEWKEKAEGVVAELIGAKPKESQSVSFAPVFNFLTDLAKAPFVPPSLPEPGKQEKREGPANQLSFLTPGKRDVVEAIEEKISKLGCRSNLRFVYIDNRGSFTRSNVAAIIGAFQQFNTKNLNALKPDGDTVTKGSWPFKARNEYLKKRQLISAYKTRSFAHRAFVMNTEELATIFHFPTLVVEAPRLRRLESKKGEPPPNLPLG